MTIKDQERIAIQDCIDENGCQIIDVSDNNYLPPFSYTIGLSQQFNHPEIISFGLSTEVLQSFLTIAKDRIEEGETFEPNKSYSGFLKKDIKVYFLPVDKEYIKDYLGYADWFYNGEDFTVLQLIWPDKKGNFPWDKNFDKDLMFSQPLLDRNVDFRFYEPKLLGVFTSKKILEEEDIIRYVIHDEEGDWFFLENDQVDNDDIQIVSLEQIVKLDPTINTIYYLQYGWEAKRKDKNAEWEDFQSEWEED